MLLFACVSLVAQPSAVKKAAKSMFKLTTFSADGTILKTGYGAFVGADGTCISVWNPFVGASSASVIDAQGRKYDVDCIIGANEIYDVAKFRVKLSGEKKMAVTPIVIAAAEVPVGGEAWLVGYDVKAPAVTKYSPTAVEKFATDLPYYTFEQTAAEEMAGSPFLSTAGELIGLMLPSDKRTDIYCPSAQYAMQMTVGGLTANEATLRQTKMRIDLPSEYQPALLALVMQRGNIQSPNYLATSEEFIKRFPASYEGYDAKANYQIIHDDCAGAAATMSECVGKSDNKAEAHYAFSRLIYNKVVNNTDSAFTLWTLDNAIDEIDKASSISPLPVYTFHKAKVLFSQKKFSEAYDAFMQVSKTNMRGGECFYDAALCLQASNDSSSRVIEMLDSAVACYEKPYTAEAASYVLARGRYYDEIGQPRKAVLDMNAYEEAMKNRVGDRFYYVREQVEVRAHLYQQALDDLDKAMAMNPRESLYPTEKAFLLVRVNKLDEGISLAQQIISALPDFGDAYAVYGLGLIQKGKKKEGIEQLNKAQTLGSEMAAPLLEKYGK